MDKQSITSGLKRLAVNVAVVGCLLLSVGTCTAKNVKRPPNVILFLVDDLGWTDLGCFGSDYYQTPNIDQLAATGTRFTNAYAACNACSPTRAAIMTGIVPARLRLTDWIPGMTPRNAKLKIPAWTKHLDHQYVTLAEALKAAGYATAHVGKWHLGGEAFYPKTHGFDENIGGSYIGAPGSYYFPYYRKPGLASGPVVNLPSGGLEGRYLTDRLADEAVKFVERNRKRPFFLNFAFYSVHTPIQPRPDLRKHYQTAVKPGKRHKRASYAAMVGAVDEAVGRVMKKIKDAGIEDETVILFTSDNGGLRRVTNNSPLREGKGRCYEGGTRVPLIVRWPQVSEAQSVCHEPVISMDLYPTILEMTGAQGDAKHNAQVDGLSLASLLKNSQSKLDRDTLYWHYPHYNPIGGVPHSSIRMGSYKLIEFFEDGHRELYDLEKDLSEKVNLAEKLPEKAQELYQQLKTWRKQIDAQLPTKNPAYQARPKKG